MFLFLGTNVNPPNPSSFVPCNLGAGACESTTASFKNISSKLDVSSIPLTFGLYGGSIFFANNFSNDKFLKNACDIISFTSFLPEPNLFLGSLSNNFVIKSLHGLIKFGGNNNGASCIFLYISLTF